MSTVADLILGAARITVICHENPDADTLGAALAIRIAAERLGKLAEVVCADPPPISLAFMPGIERVARAPALEPDVVVIVDAGDLSRIGSIATDYADWLARARIVNIDHHVSNPGFGDAQLVEPAAAATCELVTQLLPELGVPLDADLATALMAGLVNDTHTFAHPNVTADTLRVAATLVEAGAPLSAINRAIYVDKPFATLALWGRILAGIERHCAGRVVHGSMTLAMLAETAAPPSASDGFIDLLAATHGADIAILFKEAEAAVTRVSVRTSAGADAVAITAAFGGGGHARAAGCTLETPLSTARDRVLAECERELARSDARGR